MENLIQFFEHIPSLYRTLILVSGLMFFWLIENFIPLFKPNYNRFKHAGLNLFLTLTTALVNLGFAWLIVQASDWAKISKFGLLHLFEMPVWLLMIVGLLFMDLISAYFIHWLQHQVKFLWVFHLVHHTDTHVDTTTANRHHPGESVFRAVFTLLAVFVTGAPIWLVMLYQSLSALLSQFNHANINLPIWLDKTISWVIVSPNMHKIHHHYVQPYSDTNYGNIFSVWDRLFGTFATVSDMKTLVYGVDTHMDSKENDNLNNLLKIPFQPYRTPPEQNKE